MSVGTFRVDRDRIHACRPNPHSAPKAAGAALARPVRSGSLFFGTIRFSLVLGFVLIGSRHIITGRTKMSRRMVLEIFATIFVIAVIAAFLTASNGVDTRSADIQAPPGTTGMARPHWPSPPARIREN